MKWNPYASPLSQAETSKEAPPHSHQRLSLFIAFTAAGGLLGILLTPIVSGSNPVAVLLHRRMPLICGLVLGACFGLIVELCIKIAKRFVSRAAPRQ